MSDRGEFHDLDEEGNYVPMVEVDANSPEAVAGALLKHMEPADIAEVIRLLTDT